MSLRWADPAHPWSDAVAAAELVRRDEPVIRWLAESPTG
jgi:hypothetical protein